MTKEPRHIGDGTPMNVWIDEMIPRAPYDDVPMGMWQIVNDGRAGFGLEGEALANYIRKSIHALMDAGFKPVRGAGKPDRWQLQSQYGSNKHEVAEAVIAEWLRDGAPTPEPWTGLWFGLPRHYLSERSGHNGDNSGNYEVMIRAKEAERQEAEAPSLPSRARDRMIHIRGETRGHRMNFSSQAGNGSAFDSQARPKMSERLRLPRSKSCVSS